VVKPKQKGMNMNKRELVLDVLDVNSPQTYIPAGFFLHFGPQFQRGQAAVEKHLEFFNFTGMDFVKIQYEHVFPKIVDLVRPDDWNKLPEFGEEFFQEPLEVVRGLVKAAGQEALVIVTLYSPFMVAGQVNGQETITRHILENPAKAKIGMEKVTNSMLAFVRACKAAGIDGFYASTQGAETFRFPDLEPFTECIKPYDLRIWDEIMDCEFNILHVCDYHGGYSSLDPFVDYPGQVVNCSLHLEDSVVTPAEVSAKFRRPFMGGLERKGVLATGSASEVRQAAQAALQQASDRFILAADCTVPGDTRWENLKVAIDTAHTYQGS
jgi:uroporphyrinogen decarboxylase